MTTKQTLIRELVRAKYINAKREKEAAKPINGMGHDSALYLEWSGQETAFKQLLDILEAE